jgi:hypothetical protein
MDVTDGMVGRGIDLLAPGVFPLAVAKVLVLLLGNGSDQHFSRFAGNRFHAKEHLAAGLATEDGALVRNTEQILAVDAENGFPFRDQRIWLGKGRSFVREIRVVAVDMLDDVAAGLFVAAQNRPQGSDIDVIGGLPRVAAPHKNMQRGKFPDHLCEDVV